MIEIPKLESDQEEIGTRAVLHIQGVPKRCIHSLNRYNLIKLLIFAFK